MLTSKPRIEIACRALLIAVILFNALAPTSALAKSGEEIGNRYEPPTFTHPEPRIGRSEDKDISTSSDAESTAQTSSPSEDWHISSWLESFGDLQAQAGQPDIAQSTIEIVSSGSLRADGIQEATITVTVRDADSVPVPDAKVIFDIAGDGTQLQYLDDKTDINGVLNASLTSTVPGTKTVRVGIVSFPQTLWHTKTPTVVFRGAEISGIVFNDKNSNGEIDTGENKIVGIPIKLKLQQSQSTLVASTVSNLNGYYIFDGLQPGNYQIMRVPKQEVIRSRSSERSILGNDVWPIACGCNSRQRVEYSLPRTAFCE